MVFSTKNIHYYLLSIGVIFTASYFANKMKQPFESNDEYEMIRNYVLNDSPLYGYNRPKLWIHSQYQVNSRKWKSFGSRNSTDLNQPYLHLVIQSIIDKCGDDFHICLIDDESFSKLIPSWEVDIPNMADPHKQLFRELAMMQVLYHYGGMIVPNSFLCMQNLKPLYDKQMLTNKPFIFESVNKSVDLIQHAKQPTFTLSTHFMGSPKNDESLNEIIAYLENRNKRSHFTDEYQFKNDLATYLDYLKNQDKLSLLDGSIIGVKTINGKPVILDQLMEQQPLDLIPNHIGVYIPSDELLKRTKYQWFVALPEEDVLETDCVLTKMMLNTLSASVEKPVIGDIHRSIASI
jgi:hypothetical protein